MLRRGLVSQVRQQIGFVAEHHELLRNPDLLRSSAGLIPGDSLYLPSSYISNAANRLWSQRYFSDVKVGATIDGDSVSYLNTPLKAKQIEELLGKPLYNRDIYQGNDYAGVVTGLAWTAVGGEILFIETSVSKSKAPKLTLTGNLGDVMKESAVLALEYIKAHADDFGLDYRIFDQWSIHVHVPEGATPKDGPSAGITIATSLMSALSGRKVRENTAMTGEITLRGRVLPVGGIKEKILAAKRAGIKHILMSKENMKDVQEISEKYGYSTLSAFSKAFSEYHGFSPTVCQRGGCKISLFSKPKFEFHVQSPNDHAFQILAHRGFDAIDLWIKDPWTNKRGEWIDIRLIA